MEQTIKSTLIAFAIVATIFAAVFFAYNEGYLDPIIEKMGYVILDLASRIRHRRPRDSRRCLASLEE